jgi:hypothetical protein
MAGHQEHQSCNDEDLFCSGLIDDFYGNQDYPTTKAV